MEADGGDPTRQDKRPLSSEGTVDAVLLACTARLQPLLRRCGATPNALTTASLACGLVAVRAVWTDRLALFAAAHAAGYVFDCLDGQFARRYGMETAFGDWYDHVSDALVYAALLGAVVVRWGDVLQPLDVAVLALGFCLCGASLGCQQLERERAGGPSPPVAGGELLDAYRCLCPRGPGGAPPPAWVSRFGSGNFTLFFIVYVVWLGLRHRVHRQARGRR